MLCERSKHVNGSEKRYLFIIYQDNTKPANAGSRSCFRSLLRERV